MAERPSRTLDGVIRKLDQFANAKQIIAAVAPDVARNARGLTIETFSNQADPWGGQWPPPQPSTLKQRKVAKTSQSALIDTGAMFASIRDSSTADSATVTVGEGLPDVRAPANQSGHGKVPRRAFLPVLENGDVDPPQSYIDRLLAPLNAAIRKVLNQ